jgi:Acetyltransferase (GNAT) family
VPWYRAIEADGGLVGFVMLAEPTATLEHPYLWRLMIDRRHQRRRIGERTLDLVVAQARAWGGTRLEVSWMPGFGSPAPFYLARGFVPTGAMEGDEVVAELSLGPPTPTAPQTPTAPTAPTTPTVPSPSADRADRAASVA